MHDPQRLLDRLPLKRRQLLRRPGTIRSMFSTAPLGSPVLTGERLRKTLASCPPKTYRKSA
jgi:hypothetical protein